VHLLFFPSRTAETEHVHRLKLKEIQWKRGMQTEDTCVKGQEIFYGNIMPHRKTNMQLRGNDVRVMGTSSFWDQLPQLPQEKKTVIRVMKQW